MGRIRNLWVLLGLVLFTVSVCDFHVSADVIPSENECRPYIEKAIHELKNVEATGSDDDKESTEANVDENASIENEPVPESGTDDDGDDSKENAEKSAEDGNDDENQSDDNGPSQENQTEENENASVEEPAAEQETAEDLTQENDSKEDNETAEDNADEKSAEEGAEADADSKEDAAGDADSKEDAAADADGDSKEENADDSKEGDSQEPEAADSKENDYNYKKENLPEDGNDSKENDENDSTQTEENQDQDSGEPAAEAGSEQVNDDESAEKEGDENAAESVEEGDNQTAEDQADSKEDDAAAADDTNEEESVEEKVRAKRSIPDDAENAQSDEQDSTQNDDNESQENANNSADNESQENAADDDGKDSEEAATEGAESLENDGEGQDDDKESQENADNQEDGNESQENAEGSEEGSEQESAEGDADEEQESMPEEDLTMEFEIPKNLRPRGHVSDLLGLDAESSIKENALKRTGDVVLKELKRVFDNAIHPLETMYKYRDLSNRHFGDPEIFSKPLVLFMGPWSGGKSTILNYLTDNEYTPNSIRSGAEPSPAYFNILMHGDEPEVLDGTQLAADWTFSGLQKFGQGLMDRLRGQKLPNKLLERVNIVEIPGILEVRKQVSKYFPFNDACQWFIDRADIIFLVYDPSKLDVGPETEAILDQLKGREYQTRILLNKADQVKPEELLRVQGALIWNISPLMSSAQPPVMYTVSLWSHPFENGAPVRLLQAQERAFLTDLREAIDRRIENKIASARRFAVRIRNHAKMVDCYLTTYYNQKGLFSNKKQVSDRIIEHPQNYNIYEGLSTLTNISRYDLPDPEVYLDFFRLNPLYEFKKLAETCTYFKGCPINKLDIAIAYDLPELVGKYKKLQEQNLSLMRKEYDENCNQTEIDPPVKIINSR